MTPTPIRLAALFAASGNFVAWRHSDAGSQIHLDSFVTFAQLAEAGTLDFVLHGEGLALASRDGQLVEHNVSGSLDLGVVHAALTARTDAIGLVTTKSSTFNHPHVLARELASLDVLSGGRAGWNLVTSARSADAGHFRAGADWRPEERYERASRFLDRVQRLWDTPGATPPPSPQGRPPIVQAGSSPLGREFAARHADVIFTVHDDVRAARADYQALKQRVAAHGRSPADLSFLIGISFVVGRDDDEVAQKQRELDEALTSDPAARTVLESIWGPLGEDFDADGPLPAEEPDWRTAALNLGTSTVRGDALRELITEWREKSRAERLSARRVAATIGTRLTFTGTASEVADELEHWVDTGAADGFVLTPKLLPGGLGDFVDLVVPELRRRGRLRHEYSHRTLRGHLGLLSPLELEGCRMNSPIGTGPAAPAARSADDVKSAIHREGDRLRTLAEQHDRTATLATENLELLWALGAGNLTLPERLGGHGAGLHETQQVIATIGQYDPATALILVMHLTRVRTIDHPTLGWPPELQRLVGDESRHRPPLVNVLGTEPALGAGARGVPATTARHSSAGGGRWIIDGHKIYCTGSSGLRWMVVLATPIGDDGEPAEAAWFLVPADTPGIRIEPTWDQLGMRATVSHEVHFDQVEIPESHRIVRGGGTGRPAAIDTVWSIVLTASVYHGVARSALDWLVDHLNHRVPTGLGAPLASLPTFQTSVGRIHAQIETAGRLLSELARQVDAYDDGLRQTATPATPGGDLATTAGLVKWQVTTSLIQAVQHAVELVGNAGLSRRNPLERALRDILCSRVHAPHDDLILRTAGERVLTRARSGRT